MDTEGLSIICTGIGFADEDDNGVIRGYVKSEYCLDNLKDLQRYLRRDDPMRRDVFKQICKWRTVSQDLIPIIEYYQSDRNLVINAVKVLVFLTMPIDPTSCDIAQQIEYMWHLKAAMTRNVVVAAIVSLLEDPLDHLERTVTCMASFSLLHMPSYSCDAFTEDDWKLVQLVLTLFRNVLAIQDIPLHQKASGSAAHFLFLRERFLELMFQENAMDLILVLTQYIDGSCGYLHQDNLLLLEIYHYIFLGQEVELIVKASRKSSKVDGDVATSVDSLKSMMDEERKGRIIRLRNLECHSHFTGMFTRLTMDGSKTLHKGNPASAGDGLLKVHRIHRGPVKKTVWDYESLSLPKENILQLLYNFLNQFLSGGYNTLMQSVFTDIVKEHQAIQNTDIIMFFQVAQFAIAFQYQMISNSKKQDIRDSLSEDVPDHGPADYLFHGGLCGPIASTVNEAVFSLVISKWREAFEGLKQTNDFKSLSAAGSLIKNMVSRKSRKQRKKKTKNTNEAEAATQEQEKDNPEKTGSPSSVLVAKPDTVEKELGTSTSDPNTEPGMTTLGPDHPTEDSSHLDNEKLNNNFTDPMDNTEGSSSEDEAPATYESNSACTNHYIICMLRRFCDDLNLYPMLYQLSLMTTFHGILADQKASMSSEYKNIVDFLSKVVRKMMRMIKHQPLLFVEMLFWKTRKECHCINAEALQGDLTKLQNERRNLDGDVGKSNDEVGPIYKSIAESLGDDEADVIIQHNLAGQRLENSSDEALPKDFHNSKGSLGCRNSPTDKNDQNEGAPSDLKKHKPSKRQKGLVPVFDQEQEATLRHLYEKYKGDVRCSHLIAEVIAPDGIITAVHVSAKLRQLGLKISGRKRFVSDDGPSSSNKLKDSTFPESSLFKYQKKCSHMIANALDGDHTAAQVSRKLKNLGLIVPRRKRSETAKQLSDNELTDRGEQSDEETLSTIQKRNRRKRSKPSTQDTATEISNQKIHQGNGFHDELDNMQILHRGRASDGLEAVDSSALNETSSLEDKLVDSNIDEPLGGLASPADQAAEQWPQNHNELEDMFDSGDDVSPVEPVRPGSRRTLKMIVDNEDDE
ncbi:hypothetical protein J5N97_004594 [Dioscorea zingiberensis]|uniref:Timeless N-terminal domain-containing protein n=1 Tax=Dioscorea zingiberensis TaxID=325984 RepID=A0A9D5HRF7_9LILI|nr:hypothetical protein J5N97_004594 [Dioscorea zingiberensis]